MANNFSTLLAILDCFTVRLYDTYFENNTPKANNFFVAINGRNRTLQRFERLFVRFYDNKSSDTRNEYNFCLKWING